MFLICGRGNNTIGVRHDFLLLFIEPEDIGRHNALDKAIGKCLLMKLPTAGLGAVLSGRISLEMVSKCARAGIEMICAVSAPTSLALKAASQCGMSVIAFVRETRATIYTHPERVALNMA